MIMSKYTFEIHVFIQHKMFSASPKKFIDNRQVNRYRLQIDGFIDKEMDRQKNYKIERSIYLSLVRFNDRKFDRWINMQKYLQIDRFTDRKMDKKINRQKDG